MRELSPEVLDEASILIRQFRSGTLSDAALSKIFLRLRQLLPDPEFLDYTVNRVPELAPEEVVRKAFEYRPIILGSVSDASRKNA